MSRATGFKIAATEFLLGTLLLFLGIGAYELGREALGITWIVAGNLLCIRILPSC